MIFYVMAKLLDQSQPLKKRAAYSEHHSVGHIGAAQQAGLNATSRWFEQRCCSRPGIGPAYMVTIYLDAAGLLKVMP